MLLRRADLPVVPEEENNFSPALSIPGTNRFCLGKRGHGLKDLIGDITENTTIHLPARGSWSTPHLIEFLLEQIGPAECWVTSWSVKEQAIRILLNLIDEKKITGLHCLFDERIRVQCPQAHQLAMNNITDIRLTKIHAKCVVLLNDNWGIAIATSANLTRNPRIEQFVISTHREVAEFHLRWIQEEIAKSNPFEL